MISDIHLPEDRTAEPFENLSALRASHIELMRANRHQTEKQELISRIRLFLSRAEATGARLGASAERDAAETILDYWAATLLNTPGIDPKALSPVKLAPLDRSMVPDLEGRPNPYMGLSAFDEKNAGQFFGREDALRSLFEKVSRYPIVFVSGQLGSGKTSIVVSGLLPQLSVGLGNEKTKILPVIIPGIHPLESLLRAIHQVSDEPDSEAQSPRSPAQIRDLLFRVSNGHPVVIVVDQFEEIFTLGHDQTTRDAFVGALAAIAQDGRAKNRVVLITRSDRADEALQLDLLKPFTQDLDARFSPPPPTHAELLRMIELPAERVGLKFDDDVVEDIIREVTGELTPFPLLQFTLSQLWAARDRNRVTSDVYRQVGRPRDALRRTVDKVCSCLSPDELNVAKRIFLALVHPSANGPPSRRRLRREYLMHLFENPAQVVPVLDRFVEAGLIRMTRDKRVEDDRFEVVHETLFETWPLLQEWTREAQHESVDQLEFDTRARSWQRSNCELSYLLTGKALDRAKKFRNPSPDLAGLIAASEASFLNHQRTGWIVKGGAAVFVMLLVVVFGLIGAFLSSEYRTLTDQALIDRQNNVLTSNAMFELRTRDTIDKLENLLRENGILIPSDIFQWETAPQNFAQAEKEKSASYFSLPSEGYVWLGSDTEPNLVYSGSSEPVLPSMVRAGQQYKLKKSLVLRLEMPSGDGVLALGIGVVPEHTVITVLDEPVGHAGSDAMQYWARVRATRSQKPVVYLQFTTASAASAQQFAVQLENRYRISIENTVEAKGLNEVRYYFSEDASAAKRLADDVAATLKELGYQMTTTTVVRDLTKNGSTVNYPGVIELWLDLPAKQAKASSP